MRDSVDIAKATKIPPGIEVSCKIPYEWILGEVSIAEFEQLMTVASSGPIIR